MKWCIEHYKNITLSQLSLMSYQTDWLLICRRFCRQGHSGHLCTNKLGKSKHSVNSTSQSILLHKGRMISTLKPHQRLPPANAGVTDFSAARLKTTYYRPRQRTRTLLKMILLHDAYMST